MITRWFVASPRSIKSVKKRSFFFFFTWKTWFQVFSLNQNMDWSTSIHLTHDLNFHRANSRDSSYSYVVFNCDNQSLFLFQFSFFLDFPLLTMVFFYDMTIAMSLRGVRWAGWSHRCLLLCSPFLSFLY
jgi:hypothetical protein